MSETRGTYRAGAGGASGQAGQTGEIVTGRTLGRRRLALGATLNAVALAAGMHPHTLSKVEQSDEPLDRPQQAKIEAALKVVAARRARLLVREGWDWRERDMPADLRAALRLYAS